jgi:hypothetical protein
MEPYLLVMESCREMCKVEHSLFVIVPGGSFLIVCLIVLPLSLFGEFFHLIYQIFLSAMNFSSSSSSFFKEKLQNPKPLPINFNSDLEAIQALLTPNLI